MHVAVLGAGVIGISTAYYLSKAGCKVTIIDKSSGAANECSFANGAQLSYSDADPLATWGNVLQGLKWLGKKNAPLLMRFSFDPDLYIWLFKFLSECRASQFEKRTINYLLLNYYSRQQIHKLNDSLKLKYDFHQDGIIHLFETAREREAEKKILDYASQFQKVDYEILKGAEITQKEPSLKLYLSEKQGGAINCKTDEVGDAHKFTVELEKHAQQLGVKFLYNCDIHDFVKQGKKLTRLITSKGEIEADVFVNCLGAYSNQLLNKIDIKLPIYPVKGYSVSCPIINDSEIPSASIYDHKRKFVLTKIGKTFRLAGTAEFGGFDHTIREERVSPLIHAAKHFFPHACDYENATPWACLRPLTPFYTPLIGKTKYSNLYLNTGHGFLGWTAAAGSSKAIADLITKGKAEIDLSGFSPIN
ncbi:MAG: D-amino acid dehydrogenase [Rickettsiales bacterium]